MAEAFIIALGKPVKAVQTPKEQWLDTLQTAGFSEIAAKSMIAMTNLTIESVERPGNPNKGKETLQEYIRSLVMHKH